MAEPLTRDAEDYFEADARSSVRVAWREVFGDELLHPEVEEPAADELLAGGFCAIPGMFVGWGLDPREALALVLGDSDPRTKRLRDHLAREPDVVEFRGRALPPPQAFARISRLRGPHRVAARPRTRARAPRRSRHASTAHSGRAPPDDEGDLDPPDPARAGA